MGHVRLLNDCSFDDICISVKCSRVPVNMAGLSAAAPTDGLPPHLGVTEAGTPRMGVLKSAIGIGGLLCQGIGDTIRVSLTADPVEEVRAAKDILSAAGLRQTGPNLISCPTCGRTKYDMIPIAREVRAAVGGLHKPITVAVMGCVVNGPGRPSRRWGLRRRRRRGSGVPQGGDPLQGAAGQAGGRFDGRNRPTMTAGVRYEEQITFFDFFESFVPPRELRPLFHDAVVTGGALDVKQRALELDVATGERIPEAAQTALEQLLTWQYSLHRLHLTIHDRKAEKKSGGTEVLLGKEIKGKPVSMTELNPKNGYGHRGGQGLCRRVPGDQAPRYVDVELRHDGLSEPVTVRKYTEGRRRWPLQNAIAPGMWLRVQGTAGADP